MHEDTCDGLENETEKSRVIKRFSFEEDNSNHSKNNTFSQNQAIENEDIIPHGYEHKTDAETGKDFYMNMFTGVRWFSAVDQQNGKMYFYEENGNESCWTLPNVAQSIQDPPQTPDYTNFSMSSFSTSFKKTSTNDHSVDSEDECEIVPVEMRKRTATTGPILTRRELSEPVNSKEKLSGKGSLALTKTSALQER